MQRKWYALGALALVPSRRPRPTILNVALPTLAPTSRPHRRSCSGSPTPTSSSSPRRCCPAGRSATGSAASGMLLIALALFGVASLGCALRDHDRPADRGPGRDRPRRGDVMPVRCPSCRCSSRRRSGRGRSAIWVDRDRARRPARPDRRRLAARPLLVGLGLPDQRAGRRCRAGRGRALGAGVARPEAARRLDVLGVLLSSAGLVALTYGVIEARRARLGRPARCSRWPSALVARRVRVLAAARRHPLIDLALFRRAVHLGHARSRRSRRSRCSACCSRCRSTSRRSAAPTRSAPACGCCR